MNRKYFTVAVLIAGVLVGPFVGLRTFGQEQQKKPTQTAGVDNTRMGAYRALAQLTLNAFQTGAGCTCSPQRASDTATAAMLARILERTWDQGEWHNTGEKSYCKANHAICAPIDEALDAFIDPIMGETKTAPDAASVQAAYNTFLDKLKQAE